MDRIVDQSVNFLNLFFFFFFLLSDDPYLQMFQSPKDVQLH